MINTAIPKNWRNQVVVGDLPKDFLRLTTDHQSTINPLDYYNSYLNPNIRNTCRLKISICEAKLVKNYGLTRMDPYCKLQVGLAVHETPTAANGGCNPVWNQSMHITISADVKNFQINVFDERTFSADERIAWALIEIPEEARSGETVDQWFPLSGKQGTNEEGSIHLVISMTTMQMYNAQQLAYEYMESMASRPLPISIEASPLEDTQSDMDGNKDVAIALLGEMFPSFDVDVVKSILLSCNYNKEEAISILLNMYNA